jgi:type I restriction enzyme S subunit
MVLLHEIPGNWRWVRLRDVCEKPQYGYTASAETAAVGPKFLRITDIQNGEVHWERVPYCRCGAEAAACVLKGGDILFARTGGTTGKSFLVKEVPSEAIFASYLIRVRTKDDLMPEYLSLFLQSDMYWRQVITSKRGGAQPNMNATLLGDVLLPFPPLPAQKHIVAKIQESMKDVEHARLACEAQLETARALPQAYLRLVFESEETKRWERRRLGEVCNAGSGVWGDPVDNSPNCFPILRSNNIQNGTMVFDDIAVRKIGEPSTLDEKRLATGDILVTTSSGSKDLLGKSALFAQPSDGQKYLFSNFTMRLRPNEEFVEPTFLYFYLQSPRAKQVLTLLQDTTTGLRNLDRTEFLDQTVPIPLLTQQQRITAGLQERMANAERLKESIEKQLEAIKALPQAILRKAFRGEL